MITGMRHKKSIDLKSLPIIIGTHNHLVEGYENKTASVLTIIKSQYRIKNDE